MLNKNRWAQFRDYFNFWEDVVSEKRRKALLRTNKRVLEEAEYRRLYEWFRRHGRGNMRVPERRKKYDRMRHIGKKYWFKIKLK